MARSEGWPAWLRLLLLRPMAYDDGRHGIPSAPLAELRENPDAAIALWAAYIQAVARDDAEAAQALEESARGDGPTAPLAVLLRDALHAPPDRRPDFLDRATLWLRENHPDARRVWNGWEVHDGRLVARELQPEPEGTIGPDGGPAGPR